MSDANPQTNSADASTTGTDSVRPLYALSSGERGEIVEVFGGDTSVVHRLMALGFVPGTTVEVRRHAPLGDPTEYALRGTRISLRASEARCVRVRPL